MKYICHRGNIIGSNIFMENKPEYLQTALDAGYDIECDVWLQDNTLYLGHDKPLYKIDQYFLQNQRIWSHCKNIEAYLQLSKFSNINCFYQENEELVMTSRGYLWAHSKCKSWNNKTIIVSLDNKFTYEETPFAICTDYVGVDVVKYKNPFNLLIIDIDGVMTDGTKIYDQNGKVTGKNYCDLDFTAIKRFKAAGINVCFLSGDKNINQSMAATRKIDFYHNPAGIDKIEFFYQIKQDYKADKIVYVGDDYYDIGIMSLVDLAFCPNNSPQAVKNVAQILDIESGKGVIAKLYDYFNDQISYVYPIDSIHVNP